MSTLCRAGCTLSRMVSPTGTKDEPVVPVGDTNRDKTRVSTNNMGECRYYFVSVDTMPSCLYYKYSCLRVQSSSQFEASPRWVSRAGTPLRPVLGRCRRILVLRHLRETGHRGTP